MQDGMFRAGDRGSVGSAGGVSQFAEDVVARLVARDTVGGAVLHENLAMRFMDAVRSSDPAAFNLLKPELKRARISYATLADVYIPEVARLLGQAWIDDRASFAEVTMGVARLQAILREIGAAWVADGVDPGEGATLLLILPAGEQHTLGAMVIAGWLRRKGVSVCLRIAPSIADLTALVASRRFDGAMISIACSDKLETCAKLVKVLKDTAKYDLRVAIGGAVMDRLEDVEYCTGADIVTNDLSAAAKALGLTKRTLASLVAG